MPNTSSSRPPTHSRILHHRLALLCLILLSSFIFQPSASAQTGLKLQLVSETTAIVPGQPFTVGLWLRHDRGWHTYWRFPGIVGVPTQMKWKLPHGWKAGPLVYPEPERTLMFQIKAQGFERDVMLRTQITPPADLKPGASITLGGTASWMCCGNTCHPASMDLSLSLPVAATAALDPKWHALFESERARAEQPSSAWTSTVTEKGDQITLILRPATPEARVCKNQREAGRIIAFTEDGWFDTDKPQTILLHSDGTLTITLIKADTYISGPTPPKTLRTILRNDEGWLQGGKLRCLQIEPKIVRE